MSFYATGSGSAATAECRGQSRRRLLAAFAIGAGITSAAACGSSGSSAPSSPSSSSSSSATPSESAAASDAKVTVGGSVKKSTLAKGQPALFQTGSTVKQTSKGLAVTVAPNGETVATTTDASGVPQSFEVGVMVTPPKSPKLLYGVGCEGDYYDFQEQYAAVTDSTGGWEIVQEKQGKLTTLASGRTQLGGGDTQINLVCAEANRPDFTTRLSFAIDGKIVKTIDHTDKHFAHGNSFELVVADPGSGAGGTATFHHLEVRSATALP